MKKIFTFFCFFITSHIGTTQEQFIYNTTSGEVTLDWDSVGNIMGFDDQPIYFMHFVGAQYDYPEITLPKFNRVVYLEAPNQSAVQNATTTINILTRRRVPSAEASLIDHEQIPTELSIHTTVSWYRKRTIAVFSFNPLYKDARTGEIFQVTSFNYLVSPKAENRLRISKNKVAKYTANSVLANGYWAKLGTTIDGIYRLTVGDLNTLGIPTQNLSSRSIRIFGNGGGYLSFNNSAPRIDDLAENAIEIIDGGDGIFNGDDYLLFYGQNPNRWKADGSRFNHYTHYFSDTTYYFITTDYNVGTPKRILKKTRSK